jgi:hypothetical protein
MKTINFNEANWRMFLQLKLDWNKKNADEVIEELFKRASVGVQC